MKIKDFMTQLYDWTCLVPEPKPRTCDVFKIGNNEQEITKIAVSMFATPDVIRAAAEWGANLLIVHEPTFYDHWDEPEALDKKPEPYRTLINAKRKFILEHGLTVYRYHDYPHKRVPDMISEGQVKYWGLKGTWKCGTCFGVNNFELETPMPALEIAAVLEKNLDIQHIRICGARDNMVRTLGLCFGTPGHIEEELAHCDLVLTGEICEWSHGEFVRDMNGILGQKKTLFVLGHIASERQGMRLLAELLPEKWPEFPVRYFESGEPYSYTK